MTTSPRVLERPAPPRRGRRRTPLLAVAVLLLCGGLVGYVSTRPHPVPTTHWLVAGSVPGRASADLVPIEAALVGPAALADPATGRLPDTAAFHRAGVATLRLGNGTLAVGFLPSATAAQVATARAALLRSPSIATVSDGTAPEGSGAPAPVVDAGAVAGALRTAVSGTRGQPGVLVLLSTPEGVWASGAGLADVRSGTPTSPALQYRIGSTTKTFTATVVLQLVAEGRIGLDTPVERYLPGLLPYPEPITVRQLLAHTSGLVDGAHFGTQNVVPARDVPLVRDPAARAIAERALALAPSNPSLVVPPAVQVAVVTTRPLAFAPGTRYTYSNTDYLVLTLLVEKITGRPLAAEYQARILGPLGMTQTYLADSARFSGPHLDSYRARPDGTLQDATDDLSLGTAGAGAVVSTAADLASFFHALLGGRLLPEPLLREMTTPTPASAMSTAMDAYGLGLTRYATPCGAPAWGHGGAIGGYVTDVYASPDGRTVAVFAENAVGREDVRDAVTGALFCLGDRGSAGG